MIFSSDNNQIQLKQLVEDYGVYREVVRNYLLAEKIEDIACLRPSALNEMWAISDVFIPDEYVTDCAETATFKIGWFGLGHWIYKSANIRCVAVYNESDHIFFIHKSNLSSAIK